MRAKVSIVAAALVAASCSGVKSVQLRPPMPPPSGLIWGYGAEKISPDPMHGRQSAYLKAIDDLLTRGPVFVSRTIQDNTSVLNTNAATRTMQSTFRLRASGVLQPSFLQTGVLDGFVWVLIGTNENEIERGWERFVEWRSERIAQAGRLYEEASGPDRLSILEASMGMLDEAGAQDDPGLLYFEVKTALNEELRRVAELAELQKRFRALTDSGQLRSAELALDQALAVGLPASLYQQFKLEILDRRSQAAALIRAGDDFLVNEQYKEALQRYEAARLLDHDNPELPSKLALADRYHRTARGVAVRSTVTAVGVTATKAIGAYFSYKKEEERRKRAEAEAEAARAKKEAAETKAVAVEDTAEDTEAVAEPPEP